MLIHHQVAGDLVVAIRAGADELRGADQWDALGCRVHRPLSNSARRAAGEQPASGFPAGVCFGGVVGSFPNTLTHRRKADRQTLEPVFAKGIADANRKPHITQKGAYFKLYSPTGTPIFRPRVSPFFRVLPMTRTLSIDLHCVK